MNICHQSYIPLPQEHSLQRLIPCICLEHNKSGGFVVIITNLELKKYRNKKQVFSSSFKLELMENCGIEGNELGVSELLF